MNSARRYPSLGARMLRHVLVPLALTWLIGAAVALAIAHFFTQSAFDRSLLDDAYLLASNVRPGRDSLQVTLSQRELATLLYDPVERTFFAVRAPDGGTLAGESELQMAPAGAGLGHRFGDIEFRGQSLRAVILHRDEPGSFDVVVAETQVGRRALLRQLLLYSLAPQLLLLAVVGWWVARSIRNDLQPLGQLQQAVDNRDAHDLAPLEVPVTTSDMVRLGAAINALLQRLEHSVRAQREFAGNVAHELRTPLAGIRALAGYGLAQKDPLAWRAQLERIVSSEARASRLIDQLLDLALANEAAAGLTLGSVRLDELARDAVLRFLPAADAAGVDLGGLGIDVPATVTGDATLIEGILNNLLDNALRYGIDGPTGAPAVTVAIEHTPDATVLSVQDNGSGLPGEVQMQLMRRGVQGEAGELLGEGVGFGLALVAQYAQLMNARMTLGSAAKGVGWVSRVSFPRQPAQAPAPAAEPAALRAHNP